MSIVEFEFTRDTWLDRAKTPPRRTTTYLIEIPRRSNRANTFSPRLNRGQLIIFLLSLFTFSSKLSAADARTQHQPPPVTARGKTTDSRNRAGKDNFHTSLPSSSPSNGSYSTVPRCPPRFLESSSRNHLSRLSVLLSIFVPIVDFSPSGDSVNRKREKDENEKNEDLAPGGSSSTVRVTPNLLHYRPPPGSDVSGFRPCRGTWQHGSKQQHFRSEGD